MTSRRGRSSFRDPLTIVSGKTFANAGASFQALNEALKNRAEARASAQGLTS